MTRLLTTLGAIAGLASLATPAADARRAPTFGERVAIVRALPADIRAYPAGCVRFVIAISNNRRYARAVPSFLIPHPVPENDPCVRYASNGHWILKKDKEWKVVFNGSDTPSCSLGIPRDLEACRP